MQPTSAHPAAVPSMPETELEQATLLSAALGAYDGGEMFYAYVSSSLQQLRERSAKAPPPRAAPVSAASCLIPWLGVLCTISLAVLNCHLNFCICDYLTFNSLTNSLSNG